jgi:hypothetical protein
MSFSELNANYLISPQLEQLLMIFMNYPQNLGTIFIFSAEEDYNTKTKSGIGTPARWFQR